MDAVEKIIRPIVEGQIRGFLKEHPGIVAQSIGTSRGETTRQPRLSIRFRSGLSGTSRVQLRGRAWRLR